MVNSVELVGLSNHDSSMYTTIYLLESLTISLLLTSQSDFGRLPLTIKSSG